MSFTKTPVEPFLTLESTKDAIDGGNLPIRLFCNGEKRQASNTNDLIFDIPTLVRYISDYITLKPADIIFTGNTANQADIDSYRFFTNLSLNIVLVCCNVHRRIYCRTNLILKDNQKSP